MLFIEIFLTILSFAVLVGTIFFLVSVIISQRLNAPFVPTSARAVREMLALAELKPGETIVDLGCGDGRILFAAARKFGAKAVGVELNPLLYSWVKNRIRFAGLKNVVSVVRGNIFDADIGNADVITLYLFPEANRSLEEKLLREAKPDVRIVSQAFLLPRFKLVRTLETKPKIYLYRKVKRF